MLPHSGFVSQAGSITLLPLMVQQLLNLVLGESCYRSELEKPGLYVMLMVGNAECCTSTRCGHWGIQRKIMGQDSSFLGQSGSKALMISCGYSMPLRECRMAFVPLTSVKVD